MVNRQTDKSIEGQQIRKILKENLMHPDEQYQEAKPSITDQLKHLYDEVFGDYDDQSDTVDHHETMVRMKAKPGIDILQSLTPEKCHLWHMATGASTEAGELLGAVKNHLIYNNPVDVENIIEELGDLLFYLQGVIQYLQDTIKEPCLIDIFTILMYNIQKLENRYKEKYSDKEAQERRDKQQERAKWEHSVSGIPCPDPDEPEQETFIDLTDPITEND